VSKANAFIDILPDQEVLEDISQNPMAVAGTARWKRCGAAYYAATGATDGRFCDGKPTYEVWDSMLETRSWSKLAMN